LGKVFKLEDPLVRAGALPGATMTHLGIPKNNPALPSPSCGGLVVRGPENHGRMLQRTLRFFTSGGTEVCAEEFFLAADAGCLVACWRRWARQRDEAHAGLLAVLVNQQSMKPVCTLLCEGASAYEAESGVVRARC
jgi:hypothetical protein